MLFILISGGFELYMEQRVSRIYGHRQTKYLVKTWDSVFLINLPQNDVRSTLLKDFTSCKRKWTAAEDLRFMLTVSHQRNILYVSFWHISSPTFLQKWAHMAAAVKQKRLLVMGAVQQAVPSHHFCCAVLYWVSFDWSRMGEGFSQPHLVHLILMVSKTLAPNSWSGSGNDWSHICGLCYTTCSLCLKLTWAALHCTIYLTCIFLVNLFWLQLDRDFVVTGQSNSNESLRVS